MSDFSTPKGTWRHVVAAGPSALRRQLDQWIAARPWLQRLVVLFTSDDHVEVELAPNVKVRALKSTLADVKSRAAKPAND